MRKVTKLEFKDYELILILRSLESCILEYHENPDVLKLVVKLVAKIKEHIY